MSCRRPPTPQALPVIYQKLGEIPLTFFKLYLPSYCCPRCGEKGLFVKVSANDGKALTEYWELEGPRENFENMKGLELHQGVAAQGGFKCEPTRASRVVDHLDIFGEARIRSSLLVRALVQANLFIKNHAPVGPASGPQYPPTIRESARVGVSGQRETGRSGDGSDNGRVLSPSSSLVLGASPTRATPQARRGEG